MPSDASIYSLIQTPKQELPLDTAGKAMTIRAMMNQNALSGLQQQQSALALDEQQRLRQLFANNPNPSVGDVMAASPSAGMNYQKFQLDKALTGAKLDKAQADALAARATDARNSLAGVKDQASYDQWRQYGAQKGYQVAINAPAQYDPNWQKQHLYTADKLLDQLNQKGVQVDTGSGIQFRNPQTGEPMGPMIPKTLSPEAAATLPYTKGNYLINKARAAWEGVNVPGLDGILPPGGALPATVAPAPQAAAPAPASMPQAAAPAPASVAAIPLPKGIAPNTKAAQDYTVKLAAEKPRDLTALEDNVASLDQAIEQAQAILDHPGLSKATGRSAWMAETVGGVPISLDAYDAKSKLDTLKGQVMLGVLKQMKSVSPTGASGFGQLSNAEGDTLRNSITNLGNAQSEGAVRDALQTVLNSMKAAKDRLTRGYERIYGQAPAIKEYQNIPPQVSTGKIKFLGFEK